MTFFLFSLSVVIPLILAIYVLTVSMKEIENKFFIAYMGAMVIGNFISLLTPVFENAEFARWGNGARLIFVFYLNGILLFFVSCSIFYKEIFKKRIFITLLLMAPLVFTIVAL